MLLTVARIGRAHGLKGELTVELRTDSPDTRFAVGSVLATEPASAGPLTVVATRIQAARWYVQFAECTSREAAEALRDVLLVVDADDTPEPDAWYPHQLVGLQAERPSGEVVGEVIGLEHMPAQDLLVIREPKGNFARIPFVTALVPVVDVAGGRVVVDPPYGLLADEQVDDAD